MSERSRFLGYLVLRMGTAGATLVSGFAQTYVFARVLDPHTFSIFILIGNLGLSLWLFDLGIAKVLYVRLRTLFLDGRMANDPLTEEALAVTGFYALLAVAGALACLLSGSGGSLAQSAGLALFFLFSALNLAWFALRNVSSAADQYIPFETLEAARRIGHLVLMFALLLGLPFWTFLVTSNLLWAALISMMLRRLAGHGAIRFASPQALWSALKRFVTANRISLLNSGGYAAGEMFVYNYPAILTPAAMGLGAPTIVVDTMFKVFRGGTVAFSAVGDLMAPHQTRAFQRHDRRGVVRATAAALVLGGVPAAGLCGLLALWGEPLYRLLLGPAAVMPPETTPLLIALVLCNLVQTVANYALTHTGFFPVMARAAGSMSLLMGAVAVATVLFRLDVTGFMTLYAAAYAVSAATYAILALRGPLRAEAA